jgi:hypothetical protein
MPDMVEKSALRVADAPNASFQISRGVFIAADTTREAAQPPRAASEH